MAEPISEKEYEDKFEFPLWKLIKQRAKEKDISYVKACEEVVPEYVRTIRYRDTEFEDEAIQKRSKEIADLVAHEEREKES